MYLPDTNIFILGLKGSEPEASFISKGVSNNQLAISVIVVGEFFVRAGRKQTNIFEKFIAQLGTLSIDEDTARIAAEYRKQYVRKTTRTFLLDCFLAAQAKLHRLILVTNNVSDFPMRDIRVIAP